ncbi:MAG: YggS family pyridoxal phosphate enzyme [Gammaproteobacteria bacterium RIFCSPLOWO2_02_FULL_61_13]|nr:MAG: YggS family pyridoxal phosphate enzyme [Gammaproteobacteria bacterium RIFCSPLOWO2_02_FULL_61_13]
MQNIAQNLAEIRAELETSAARYGRSAAAITLLAVSKSQGPAAIRAVAACGQREFGESYLQEAIAKMGQLSDLPLTWHFIGPVQANKTRLIARHFHWVHSVDRDKIARRLAEARAPAAAPLNVCLEVNISGESTKAGVAPAAAVELARYIAALPGLRLRGLMAMPEPATTLDVQRAAFRRLRELFAELRQAGLDLDTLSMGTTSDLEAAIAEGATIVRVGTGIFGPRT